MHTGPDEIPTEALADVAFVSRSANRVAILEELRRGPRTRRALAEATGSSRTTTDRIVNELEDRGWAERTPDGDYGATATGSEFVAQFSRFLRSVVAIRRLGEAVEWLPDDRPIGLEQFHDASVRRPEGDDPLDTVDYFVEQAATAPEIRVLAHLAPPEPLERTMHDGVTAGRVDGTYVVTDEALAYLRGQPDRRARWREMIDAGADCYHYSGEIPCNLFVFGETALIKKSGSDVLAESYGRPIVSENEAVRSWVLDVVDAHRADATRLSADAFAGERTTDPPESDEG